MHGERIMSDRIREKRGKNRVKNAVLCYPCCLDISQAYRELTSKPESFVVVTVVVVVVELWFLFIITCPCSGKAVGRKKLGVQKVPGDCWERGRICGIVGGKSRGLATSVCSETVVIFF